MSTTKKSIANNLLKITTGLANTSTVMSPFWIWGETKLPNSLLKK